MFELSKQFRFEAAHTLQRQIDAEPSSLSDLTPFDIRGRIVTSIRMPPPDVAVCRTFALPTA